jgi:signal transduction histidine kinase
MRQSGKLLLILSMLYAGIILALGSWWLYLIVKYGEKIAEITGEGGERTLKMVKWEGGTFLTLLILLSASLLFLYWKDQIKTKGLQAFFASMTHELKTPLASIRLQSEVLAEELEENTDPKIERLVGRLIEDTNKMETQMDKILQLSRIEGGGTLNLITVDLRELLENAKKRWGHSLKISMSLCEDCHIRGDELGLQLILRNLFENTLNHANSKEATISLTEEGTFLILEYSDNGNFQGDPKKLGNLFYKFNSKKGSGIGLYLIKKLTQAMKGIVDITTRPQMKVRFKFLKADS